MTVRITCIKKSAGFHADRHEGITELGWIDEVGKVGRNTRLQIVQFIESGNFAYVQNGSGKKAYVGVIDPKTRPKYLRTHADGVWNDNLLSLLECK